MTSATLAPALPGQALKVSPLQSGLPFGATIEGLKLPQLQDPHVRRALHDLWIDRGVILFRGGDSSAEMQIELSRCFGTPEEFPFPESRAENHRELVKVKYYPEDGTIFEIDGKALGGWLPWHSDLIYTDRINRGGILRPAQLPRKGGGKTGFIDKIAAYAALPDDLKQRIEGLHGVHFMDINAANQRFGVQEQRRAVRFAKSAMHIMHREWQYPRVLHPLVYRQQETGRPVLNVAPWFIRGVYELGGPEGDALLNELVEYCTDARQAYFHDWREDDMVLWDNWRTLHSATGVDAGDTRVMYRTTISGDYALGRKLDSTDGLPRYDV